MNMSCHVVFFAATRLIIITVIILFYICSFLHYLPLLIVQLYYENRQVARQLDTLRTQHINKVKTLASYKLALAIFRQYLSTIGNRSTNSKKQQLSRHNELSLAKYRILNRLTGEYLQLIEDYPSMSIFYSQFSQLLQLQIIVQLIGTLYTCSPSEALSAFQPLCNYCQLGLPGYNKNNRFYIERYSVIPDYYVLQPLANCSLNNRNRQSQPIATQSQSILKVFSYISTSQLKLSIEWSKQSAKPKAVFHCCGYSNLFFPTHFFYFSFTLLEAQKLGLYRIRGGGSERCNN